ncbi:hypothetical protein ACTGZQ_01945 [Streptococcus suis]
MKKIILMLALISTFVAGVLAWKFISYKHASFKPDAKADFYLIYPGHINSYKLKGDQPTLLTSQELPSKNYLGSGTNFTLGKNTLIFSEAGFKFTIGNIVSLDFDSGKILRQPSKYATVTSGSDGKYFYTAGVTDKLAQFDNKLKLIKEVDLPEFFHPTGSLHMDDKTIYLVGTEHNPDDPDNWKELLVLVDKESMKVSESLYFDRKMTVQYSYLMNGILYLPIIAYANDNGDMSESKQILTFDTDTKKFATINIEQPSPARIHSLNSSNSFLIEHDGYTTNDIRFTIYDTKTGKESSHVFPDVNPSYLTVSHLQSLDDERLLLIVGDQLYLYNWKTKEVLNQMSLDSDYITGIWLGGDK